MGDPLSVAASVTGLVSLGIQVTQSLVDLYTAYRDQDADINSTTRNLGDLLTILQSLENALEQRKFRDDEQSLIAQIERSIGNCEEIIHELQDELQKFNKTVSQGFTAALKTAGHRVAYPFRRSSLQALDEKIHDMRQNIALAQDVLQLNDSSNIRNDVEDIKAVLALVRSSQISGDLQTWLKAPDATTNHNDACAKKHPSTGMWLVRGSAFETWLTEANSFLWVNGFAGCGKSVLCSTAIQYAFRHRRSSSRIGIAFFYFSFNDNTKQDAPSMLRALLLQLSGQLTDGYSDLYHLHATYPTSTPPLASLLGTLQDIVRKFQDVYLVFDALDESPQGTAREGLLALLTDVRSWKFDGLHVLVTSRDILDIREVIEQWGPNVSMKNEGVDKDIAEFIKGHLQESPTLRKWATHHELIREALTSRAEGVFRWVECQFKSLAQCPRSEAALKKRLNCLPRSLDETYERMLSSIDEDCVEDAKRILTLLCFSMRPMTIAEVIDGVAVELGEDPKLNLERRLHDENDLLQICPGLIEISVWFKTEDLFELDQNHQEQTVRIAHFSVQEYLQSSRMLQQQAAPFSMDSIVTNDEIAQICLVYLLDPALSNDFDRNAIYSARPLLRYAAEYWYAHHKLAEDHSRKRHALLVRFFQEQPRNLQNWILIHEPHADVIGPPVDNIMAAPAAPIYYASLLGLTSIVSHLCDVERRKGLCAKEAKDAISINASNLVNFLDYNAGYYGSALNAALYNGHIDVVKLLIDEGADVNYRNEDGEFYTALEAASYNGSVELVELLLERGADINAQGGYHGNALQLASISDTVDIVKFLIARGADVNAQGGHYGNALQAASARYFGSAELIDLLLARGADINAQGGYLGSALQAVSFIGSVELAELLLRRGANVNTLGGHYGTALQAASGYSSVELVELLLASGADVNAQGGHWGNALQAASTDNLVALEKVRLLLASGADVNAQGGGYGNALQAASCCGNIEVVKLLLEKGAEINAQGGVYSTALHAACISWSVEMVQLLLDRGADINAKGHEYRNALDAATRRNQQDIVRLLLERGAKSAEDNVSDI